MTTVLEIERAIEQLPSDQFSKIHDWIVEKDWQRRREAGVLAQPVTAYVSP